MGAAATLGVDIGGTKVAAGLVAADGTVLAEERADCPADDGQAVVQVVADLLTRLDPQGGGPVGVAAAGYLDADRESVLFAPNLSWRDFPLRDLLQRSTSRPVVLENDANAAALGEYVHGAGQDARALLVLTLGTGVGGGFVDRGRVLRGGFGCGAEMGHIRVERDGRACGCGLRGCLEAYASGSALERRALEAAGQVRRPESGLWQQLQGQEAELDGEQVTRAADAGDPWAVELLEELATWVGEGLSTLCSVLDPDRVLLGGGLGQGAGERLAPVVQETLARTLSGAGHRPVAPVGVAELGGRAGMIGAAALARKEHG